MIEYKEIEGEINEGDACICNFHDSAMKFWFSRGQILFAKIVQKLTKRPNRIWFEEIENPVDGFYANSFTKISIIHGTKEEKR